MRCPHCGNMDDKVLESRQNSSGTSIRRRRECLRCHYRYTSYERIEEKPVMVIKRDGRREPFDIQKLERGVQTSLEKRDISQNAVENLIHEVEDISMIQAGSRREISSQTIGELVLKKLYAVDPVAYVRFASVYRMFENVSQFVQEIETLSPDTDGD
jgi:transcriptional repressor NrdR